MTPREVRRPPEEIVLRAMKSSDISQVRALHRTLLPVSYPVAFFVQLLLNPRHFCLVATDAHNGLVVGFASAAMDVSPPSHSPCPDQSYKSDVRGRTDQGPSDIPRSRITLLTLGVSPPYQRRGIGRSLVHGVVHHLGVSYPGTQGQPWLPVPEDNPNEEMRIAKTAVLVQVQVANSNFAGKCFYMQLGMIHQWDPEELHIGVGARTSVMAGVIYV